MKIAPYLFLCCFVSALYSCKNERHQSVPPEEVIRQYQGFIDLNLYEEAKALSTPDEQKRLDLEAQIIAMEVSDSTIFHTTFLKIDCRETGDTAICKCLLEDEYGEYDSTFRLLKMAGIWRVDVPMEEEEENSHTAPMGKMESSLQKL